MISPEDKDTLLLICMMLLAFAFCIMAYNIIYGEGKKQSEMTEEEKDQEWMDRQI